MINFSSDTGYPTIFVGGKNVLLHRYVWEKHYGKIPNGYQIHHKNKNRLDYDVSNLELIPISEHHRKHALENGLGISNKGKFKHHVSGFCGIARKIIAIKDSKILYFDSIADASRGLKLDAKCISRVLSDKKPQYKSHHGWKFEYGK